MKNCCEFFKDKKITLMGLGVLGRGVGDAEFFAKCGAKVLVTDLKTEDKLKNSVDLLKKYNNIEFVLGKHRLKDFEATDIVVKSAGAPTDSEYIAHALKKGVLVTMSTALFVKIASKNGVKIIGVTGTRGKTTVTNMIFETLARVNKNSDTNVFLGGNIRGVSTISLLPKIKKGDICVLELDSWQLQGFAYEKTSPHIAVFTNFYEDHLNYYKNMDEYFADKSNIFKYQNEQKGDTLIIGEQVEKIVHDSNPPVAPIVAVPIPSHWTLSVPGVHNRENAALAREALSSIGIFESDIKYGLENFKGTEGRLEYVGKTKNGTKIYNDNNATSPEATKAALEALVEDGSGIILIAGGTDKGFRLEEVAKEINNKCERVFLLEGSGTKRLSPLLKVATVHDTFSDTVRAAFDYSKKTGAKTILFSPMFSSFGKEFVNEYDRGDKFKNIIKPYLC